MSADLPPDPLRDLGAWIEEAREEGLAHPAAATFATADAEGRPSARTVTLKRLELDALVFSSALWTRKARDIEANPHVALLFFWPELGRQAQKTLPRCPDDWGALLVTPSAVELWTESPDRLHDRRLFTRSDDGWAVQLLSP